MSKASLGFGLEKSGLIALRWPLYTLAAILVITVISAIGIRKLTSDAALSELFHSSSPHYTDYKKMSDRFPSSEFDVLVVVEGKDLLTPENLDFLGYFATDLLHVEALDGITSMFDVRVQEKGMKIPSTLIPADLPKGEAFEALKKQIMAHPLIGDKLLSQKDEKGQVTLFVLTLNREKIKQNGLKASVEEVRAKTQEAFAKTDLKFHLTGVPVMQLDIRSAIKKDRLTYNATGFLLGFVICIFFLKRIKLAVIASICPLLAVIWSLGLFGHLEVELNTFLNVIPPLVMVITYSDSMHLVHSIRRRIAKGEEKTEAIRQSILHVGPACVLTSLTTALAMLSFVFTDSAIIWKFGLCSAVATMFGFFAVIFIVPMACYLWLGNEKTANKADMEEGKGMQILEVICRKIADWIQKHHIPVAAAGCLLILSCVIMHLQLHPHYRLSDQLPKDKKTEEAAARIDSKLTGALPISVMMTWPKDKTIADGEVQNVIAGVHQILEKQPEIGNVLSTETLRHWLKENLGTTDPKVVVDNIKQLPSHLTKRFLNESENSALITGRMPNLDADQIVPIIDRLNVQFGEFKKLNPNYEFAVTGLVTLTSLQSSNMISQLNQGLLVSMVIVIILIGVAFRSWSALWICILPNLFPIMAAGALLYLTGRGLEYASVIALTIAFGLAVDDTIHFLSRLDVEKKNNKTMQEAVYQSLVRIGPVLILTTVVLVLGLSVTIFSDLPAMYLFGLMSMVTLIAALLGDLFILPAILLTVERIKNMLSSKLTKPQLR